MIRRRPLDPFLLKKLDRYDLLKGRFLGISERPSNWCVGFGELIPVVENRPYAGPLLPSWVAEQEEEEEEE